VSNFDYRLQRSPVGVILVDQDRRVVAANPLAHGLLSPIGGPLLGRDLLSLHPPTVRSKVQWMLDAAQARPDEPVGMSMTLPMGSLIARVTMMDSQNGPQWCLVFHLPENFGPISSPATDDLLVKLPVGSGMDVTLLDVANVLYLEAEGHYTRVHTPDGQHFCALSLAELSRRLDPASFLRVHRSYVVNLRRAHAIDRRDGHWSMVMDAPGGTKVPVSRARVELVRKRLAL
jgi:LytTR family transcriptional regulator, CO-responsive transcriptional regulator RcoM